MAPPEQVNARPVERGGLALRSRLARVVPPDDGEDAERAQAIAVERAAALDDVRTALASVSRMLAPGPPITTTEQSSRRLEGSTRPPSPARRLLNYWRKP